MHFSEPIGRQRDVRKRVHQAVIVFLTLWFSILAGIGFALLLGWRGASESFSLALGFVVALLLMIGLRAEFYGTASRWIMGPPEAPTAFECWIRRLFVLLKGGFLPWYEVPLPQLTNKLFSDKEDVLRELQIDNIGGYQFTPVAKEAILIRVDDEASLGELMEDGWIGFQPNIASMCRVMESIRQDNRQRRNYLVVALLHASPPTGLVFELRKRFRAAIVPEEWATQLVEASGKYAPAPATTASPAD